MWTTQFFTSFSLKSKGFFKGGGTVDNPRFLCGEKCGRNVDLWKNVDTTRLRKMNKYAKSSNIYKNWKVIPKGCKHVDNFINSQGGKL